MPKRKLPSRPPPKLEGMDVDEALERFAGVHSSEALEEEEKGEAVHLFQREGDAPPILFYATDKGMKLELRFTEGSRG